MNRARLKEVLRQQSALLPKAVEEKLRSLMFEDDFASDIFEQVDSQCITDELEKAFGVFTEKRSVMQRLKDHEAHAATNGGDDLDVIYSHRAEDLAKELPKNRIKSYYEKIAALRGISMAEDYYSVKKS